MMNVLLTMGWSLPGTGSRWGCLEISWLSCHLTVDRGVALYASSGGQQWISVFRYFWTRVCHTQCQERHVSPFGAQLLLGCLLCVDGDRYG